MGARRLERHGKPKTLQPKPCAPPKNKFGSGAQTKRRFGSKTRQNQRLHVGGTWRRVHGFGDDRAAEAQPLTEISNILLLLYIRARLSISTWRASYRPSFRFPSSDLGPPLRQEPLSAAEGRTGCAGRLAGGDRGAVAGTSWDAKGSSLGGATWRRGPPRARLLPPTFGGQVLRSMDPQVFEEAARLGIDEHALRRRLGGAAQLPL